MTSVGLVNSINDEITKANEAGISSTETQPFLKNVTLVETNPQAYIYAGLVQQNTQLARKIIDINTKNLTEDKKGYHKVQQNAYLEYILGYLLWIYYGSILFFVAFLYSKSIVTNIYFLLFLVVILVLYPVWMIWLERGVMIIYRFFASIIFGIPFAWPRQLYVFQMPTGQNINF
jgi:K+-sensing histidine kinase KdpD